MQKQGIMKLKTSTSRQLAHEKMQSPAERLIGEGKYDIFTYEESMQEELSGAKESVEQDEDYMLFRSKDRRVLQRMVTDQGIGLNATLPFHEVEEIKERVTPLEKRPLINLKIKDLYEEDKISLPDSAPYNTSSFHSVDLPLDQVLSNIFSDAMFSSSDVCYLQRMLYYENLEIKRLNKKVEKEKTRLQQIQKHKMRVSRQ